RAAVPTFVTSSNFLAGGITFTSKVSPPCGILYNYDVSSFAIRADCISLELLVRAVSRVAPGVHLGVRRGASLAGQRRDLSKKASSLPVPVALVWLETKMTPSRLFYLDAIGSNTSVV
ncbi:MAG: hypothetical protein ACPGGN_08190, partial [Opitutales bacterium]